MNSRSSTFQRRTSRTLLLLSIGLLHTCVSYAVEDKRRVTIQLPDLLQEWAAVTPVDYFDKDRNQVVRQTVFNRERYHLGKGFNDSYEAGNYSAAIADLRFILKSIPNHPKALFYLVSICTLAHNPTLPAIFFQRAIKLYPSHAITYAQYGNFLVGVDEIDRGIEALQQAIEMDPKLAITHAWLAEAYYKKGDKEHGCVSEEHARQLGFVGDIARP